MMDVYMVITLTVGFGLLLLFTHWCGTLVDQGGEEQ
jgi:hypothetical protein